jgi:hypothetical protein
MNINIEVMRGRILQLAGKVFEVFGRITGSELQRRHGYQLVIVGQMRVLGGQAADLLRYCDPRQASTVEPRRLR